MKNFSKILIGLLLIIIIIALPVMSSYNNLVTLEQNANTAESNIDTQLQRRSDLIPNLVNTVKGYANLESEIYTNIANARSKLSGASTIEEEATADQELTSALSRLLVVVENYPELKSSSNFQDLTIELEGTENRITIARQDYNDAVTKYNTKMRKFPSNIIASIFNFEQKPLYKASEGSKTAPSVDFSN
ncbi:MAG: LemA family protein [Clostridium sp.]|nr:LemA family protein [Clostridium sp.]